jgi:hypothetical protein
MGPKIIAKPKPKPKSTPKSTSKPKPKPVHKGGESYASQDSDIF